MAFKEKGRVKRVSQVLSFRVRWALLFLAKIWNIGERVVLCNERGTSESSTSNRLFLRDPGQIQAEVLVGRYEYGFQKSHLH